MVDYCGAGQVRGHAQTCLGPHTGCIGWPILSSPPHPYEAEDFHH